MDSWFVCSIPECYCARCCCRPERRERNAGPRLVNGKPVAVNEDIRAREVRVLTQDKENIGVMSLREAVEMVRRAGWRGRGMSVWGGWNPPLHMQANMILCVELWALVQLIDWCVRRWFSKVARPSSCLG